METLVIVEIGGKAANICILSKGYTTKAICMKVNLLLTFKTLDGQLKLQTPFGSIAFQEVRGFRVCEPV